MRRLSARRVFLLLDTCKSGDAVQILADRTKDERALRIFGSNLGLNFVAAATKGQNALEVNKLGHGVSIPYYSRLLQEMPIVRHEMGRLPRPRSAVCRSG